MKNFIVVTGGAGFIGSNLIEYFVNNTKFKIISVDNYSSGSKKNHIKNNRVKYLRGDTKNINKILSRYKNKINAIFHFGEFARIYESFKNFRKCFQSNTVGSKAVIEFCLNNKIKLIYSATSATLGNSGKDKHLSPYAFTKSKNLELLENLKKWFKFRFEIIYFYNVYGPRHIKTGSMATVIGIFEHLYKKKQPLTVVKPGTQTRSFTHVHDTVKICIDAWKLDKSRHYSISHKKSYSILEVAKMFGSKLRYLKAREGERFTSSLPTLSQKNTIIRKFGKINLKDYVSSFING